MICKMCRVSLHLWVVCRARGWLIGPHLAAKATSLKTAFKACKRQLQTLNALSHPLSDSHQLIIVPALLHASSRAQPRPHLPTPAPVAVEFFFLFFTSIPCWLPVSVNIGVYLLQ